MLSNDGVCRESAPQVSGEELRTVSKDPRRWTVLGFAFSATCLNYLDRQSLSVMAPALMERFHLSSEAYSAIVFAFMAAYCIMNGVSGPLLDRLGTRIGYAFTVGLWSIAEVLHVFAAGAGSLAAFRFLLGAGEAGNYPACVKLTTEWFPPEERSLASGVFNSGAAIGSILAPPLIAWIFLKAGWRVAFLTFGITGFVWLAAWMVFYRPLVPNDAARGRDTVPIAQLLRTRFVWQFTVAKFLTDPVWYFYTFWVPEYLHAVHGLSMKAIGEVAWIPFATAAIGNMVGAGLFSAITKFGAEPTVARRVCVAAFSLCMSCAIAIPLIHGPAGCIGVIAIATLGYSGSLANSMPLPGDIFPSGCIAAVYGFASMGSAVGGMLFSLVTGWLVQRISYNPVFVLFGIIPLLGAWLMWTLPRGSYSAPVTELA
jgi:MFS transporter, ACS family, hexuronate transporter